jgi:hypothetical protein
LPARIFCGSFLWLSIMMASVKRLLLVVVVLLGYLSHPRWRQPAAAAAEWPAVEGLKTTFRFVDGRQEHLDLRIRSRTKEELYRLDCFLNAWEHAARDFDYSGAFECRLTPVDPSTRFSTLLTEEPGQSRDWESRGRFLLPEIQGQCGEYPEFGRVRTFRLRGMKLTLEITDLRIAGGSARTNLPWKVARISELGLNVAVEVDAGAQSEIAEPARYLPPPRKHPGSPGDLSLDCSRVLLAPRQ